MSFLVFVLVFAMISYQLFQQNVPAIEGFPMDRVYERASSFPGNPTFPFLSLDNFDGPMAISLTSTPPAMV